MTCISQWTQTPDKVINMQEKNSLAYNVIKSLIRDFLGGEGRGCKAICRIVRSSEKNPGYARGSPLPFRINKTLNKKLESASYYALRALLNLGNSLDYDSILSAVNMQSLEHRRYYQSLILLLKCIKGNGPDYISDLFEPRILRYNLRNSDHNLTQPSYNNRYYHISFTYKASYLWNQLPSYIKRSTELSEFRKHLRSLIL